MPDHDPRVTPARPDLAADHLRGTIAAERYVTPQRRRIAAPTVALRSRPGDGAIDSELLLGEDVDLLDTDGDWAWVQSVSDGYVGYVAAETLAELAMPTHVVSAMGTNVYGRPELKSRRAGVLPFGVRVTVSGITNGYCSIQGADPTEDLWLPRQTLRALDQPEDDWVAVAERFLGTAYYWGGRSSWGLDCSALVQLSLQAAGRTCPRDSDQQQAALGRTLDDAEPLCRGDLIFWKGHVGIVAEPQTLLHANAHHMAVAREPLDGALTRIAKGEFGTVTRRARLDAAADPA